MAKCNRPAEFLLRYPSGRVQAACEEHAEIMLRQTRIDAEETS
jgi:hypothetical protein